MNYLTKQFTPYYFPQYPYRNSSIGISVVLTCHSAYLCFLEECVNSINKQNFEENDERIICLDNCDIDSFPPELFRKWKVIKGDWKNPNPARNLGIKESNNDWIVFFDADNVMPPNYLDKHRAKIQESDSNIAFIYPDIEYCDQDWNYKRTVTMPDWDYWTARENTYFDTSSSWSKKALLSVGGWIDDNKAYDDYRLVLRLSRSGWKAKKLDYFVKMREHHVGVRRSIVGWETQKETLWNERSLTVLSVLAGRDKVFDKWANFVENCVVPPNCSLFLLDNSNNKEFNTKLVDFTKKLDKFQNISIKKYSKPFIISEKDYLDFNRHQHIAMLYNAAFQEINTDLIFCLEDDVIPEKNDLLKRLSDLLFINNNIAAVGAAYRSGHMPETVCAALDMDKWLKVPQYLSLSYEPMEVGFMGAGATLYQNSAIKKAMPMQAYKEKDGYMMGWDGWLCKRLRQLNYKLFLDGWSRCQHLAWGEKELKA